MAQLGLDAGDALLVALQQHLYGSIGAIRHPPAKSLPARKIVGEKPKPDALHTTT